MTYSAGQQIKDDDYNVFVAGSISGAANHDIANVNTLWGAGSTTRGYGQSGNLAAVSPGAAVSATQWANLLNRLTTIGAHQGTAITSIPNPATGDRIDAYTALQTNMTNTYNLRRNAAASGTSTATTFDLTAAWTSYAYPRFLVSFASAAAMRYFFNAGGLIKFNISRTGGSSTAKNAEWTDLCNKCGTIVYSNGSGTAKIAGTNYTGSNKIGGGGTVNLLTSTYGFFDTAMNDTWVNLFKQFADSSPYTANNVTWYAKGRSDAKSIDFAYNLADAAEDSFNDTVDGTVRMTCTIVQPSTTHIGNVWGTITATGRSDGQA